MSIVKYFLKKYRLEELFNFSGGKKYDLIGIKSECQAFFCILYCLMTSKTGIIILPDEKKSIEVLKALKFFNNFFRGDFSVGYFPDYDRELFLPLEVHPSILIERIRALWHLAFKHKIILLTSVPAVMRKVVPLEAFLSHYYKIEEGGEITYDFLIQILVNNGYKATEMVTTYGEYSCRGGIVDIFSPAYTKPVRLQFYGDVVESIRFYDVGSQLSLSRINEFEILPCREFIITNLLKEKFSKKLDAYCSFISDDKKKVVEQLYMEERFAGYEDYLPIFFNNLSSIFDYVGDEAAGIVIESDYIINIVDKLYAKVDEDYEKLAQRQIVPFNLWELILTKQRLKELIEMNELSLSSYLENMDKKGDREKIYVKTLSANKFEGNIVSLIKELKRNYKNRIDSYLIFSKEGRLNKIKNALRDEQLGIIKGSELLGKEDKEGGRIIFVEGELVKGFSVLDNGFAFYTEEDIFGEHMLIDRKYEVPLDVYRGDLGDLNEGDYVVHINHGVGIYRGLNSLYTDGKRMEVMTIEYAGGDLLYLPVEHLNLVQRYIGSGDDLPTVDRLGGRSWEHKKKKAKKAIEGMVKELIELYAIRKAMKGVSFLPDDAIQNDFESYFEYEETPDQLKAIEEIKRDMESDNLMDRLLCGDVGYGKTEVAMRAALKAVLSGKQVALLAPTTVLAFQHYQTFIKRFEHFPLKIAMVSRLTPKKELSGIIADIILGRIDIIIGTHRILSDDIKFADLGLLIIDEEQRFGVMHKEKLKNIYKNIDVLLLSATPIPRTLEMALMGIRDMSVINTPPQDRLSIQTHVVKFSEEIINSAINRELEREGQVFFIHNNIENLCYVENLVKKLCPSARVTSAHGRMHPKRIEDVMLSFMNYEYDVLVCTTIIENGIDIPRANTIIINNADKFGLSQLYQLRGRVGRSSRRAYAYLLISKSAFLSEMAKKRLAALKEFSELGSGFRLAAADLQIRGAGNLLGKQQHGHIIEIGFESYCSLLEETTKKMLNLPIQIKFEPEIKINLDFQIPIDYISSDTVRMQFYKRISKATSSEELKRIQYELIDRFGNLPREVESIFLVAELKLIARQKNIAKIIEKNNKLYLRWGENVSRNVFSEELISKIFQLAMNSSMQFLPDNSLMLPFTEYRKLIEFMQKLPDFSSVNFSNA